MVTVRSNRLTQDKYFSSKQAMTRLFAVLLFMLAFFTGFLGSAEVQAEERIVRVGYFTDNDAYESGYDDDAPKNGYAYAYIQEIAKHTGWKYKYVYGRQDELLAKLNRGEIDIMGGISPRNGNISHILFPGIPMGREDYHVLVHDDRPVENMGSPQTLEGLRIGVQSNSTIEVMLRDFVKQHNINCEIISLRNSFSRMEMFRHRRLDAVAVVEYNMMEGVKSVINFGGTRLFLCVAGDRPDLLAELNNAQEEIFTRQPSFDKSLHERYLSKQYVRRGLNQQEKDWLRSRHIRIGCLRDFLPYSGYDKRSGQWAGVVTIAAERVRNFTGCEVSLMPFDNQPELIEALKQGYVEAAFPIYDSLWYAEQDDVFSTGKFAPDRTAIVYRGDFKGDIYKKIGIVKLTAPAMGIMRDMFPKSEFQGYDTLTDCLEAVENGEVSSAVASGGVLYRYLDQVGEFSNLHIINVGNIDYGFVTRRENRIFYGVLSRCLLEISPNDINDSIISSTYVASDYSVASFIRHNSGKVTIGFCIFILLLIVNFYVYWRRTLRHNKEMSASLAREASYSSQLKSANEDLQRQMNIIREQEGIITIDALTQVNNRYQLEKYTKALFAEYDPSDGEKIYLAISDLDKFKSINDTFGHNEGDRALVIVANAMKTACGWTQAFLARYGGDEFVIIVKSEADGTIRDICRKVDEILAKASQELPYVLSASFGIAECDDPSESFEKLFRRADNELYKVKSSGKR